MRAIRRQMDKKICELESYCRRFFQYENVMVQLADIDRLKRAVAILRDSP